MTPAFELFYDQHLSPVEGGEVDIDVDRGGATWYGISSGFLKGIGRKGPISKADAKKISFEYFWEPAKCDEMDPVAAWSYCDALFNHSPRAAARIFQGALGVKVDGSVGPKTRAAAKDINQRLFVERYRIARTRYYVSLVKNDPTQFTFFVGWVDRVHRLNQAMLVNGLFEQVLKDLPWHKSVLQSEQTKVNTIGVAGGGALLAMFFPDLDLSSVQGFFENPELWKAGVGGIVLRNVAKWRAKNTTGTK